MARIAGIDIPPKKPILYALQYLHGIGHASALRILEVAKIDQKVKAGELSDQQVAKIREEIDKNYKVEGDVRKEMVMDIKRLMDLGAYRGLRHKAKLPVRGQRTHTNARTRKGRPRIAVAGKKRAPGPN